MKKRVKKLNVFVLMGGKSAEHDVSLGTGAMVLKNLDRKKFNVTPVLISKSGTWLIGQKQAGATYLEAMRPPANAVAFIAMHGPYGEDGTVQGLLELAGIPYTGSGVAASALAMDKILSAELFRGRGIAVPEFVAFDRSEWHKNKRPVTAKIKKLGLPVVIKPSNLGSSVGITIVRKRNGLGKAVRLAFSHSPQVMAQKYIRGRELTCGVIDKGEPGTEMALQPTEIVPKTSTFFDYRAKYTPGASEEITPPRLPATTIGKIRHTALSCHKALGCSGMSRTDMILANDKLYVLEVNTIPGMTETSLLPQAAKACGISFPQLLERIILAALNRSKYNYS